MTEYNPEVKKMLDKILPSSVLKRRDSEGDVARYIYKLLLNNAKTPAELKPFIPMLTIPEYALNIAIQLRYLDKNQRQIIKQLVNMPENGFNLIHDFVTIRTSTELDEKLQKNGTLNDETDTRAIKKPVSEPIAKAVSQSALATQPSSAKSKLEQEKQKIVKQTANDISDVQEQHKEVKPNTTFVVSPEDNPFAGTDDINNE